MPDDIPQMGGGPGKQPLLVVAHNPAEPDTPDVECTLGFYRDFLKPQGYVIREEVR